MTIFDFVPQLRNADGITSKRSTAPSTRGLAEALVNDFVAQQVREQREWEHICERAWTEMERDIQAFTSPHTD
ncbi:MAG: hypothetical protein ACFB9N_10700 [Geitlerinemataceae cyanobacterium]